MSTLIRSFGTMSNRIPPKHLNTMNVPCSTFGTMSNRMPLKLDELGNLNAYLLEPCQIECLQNV